MFFCARTFSFARGITFPNAQGISWMRLPTINGPTKSFENLALFMHLLRATVHIVISTCLQAVGLASALLGRLSRAPTPVLILLMLRYII